MSRQAIYNTALYLHAIGDLSGALLFAEEGSPQIQLLCRVLGANISSCHLYLTWTETEDALEVHAMFLVPKLALKGEYAEYLQLLIVGPELEGSLTVEVVDDLPPHKGFLGLLSDVSKLGGVQYLSRLRPDAVRDVDEDLEDYVKDVTDDMYKTAVGQTIQYLSCALKSSVIEWCHPILRSGQVLTVGAVRRSAMLALPPAHDSNESVKQAYQSFARKHDIYRYGFPLLKAVAPPAIALNGDFEEFFDTNYDLFRRNNRKEIENSKGRALAGYAKAIIDSFGLALLSKDDISLDSWLNGKTRSAKDGDEYGVKVRASRLWRPQVEQPRWYSSTDLLQKDKPLHLLVLVNSEQDDVSVGVEAFWNGREWAGAGPREYLAYLDRECNPYDDPLFYLLNYTEPILDDLKPGLIKNTVVHRRADNVVRNRFYIGPHGQIPGRNHPEYEDLARATYEKVKWSLEHVLDLEPEEIAIWGVWGYSEVTGRKESSVKFVWSHLVNYLVMFACRRFAIGRDVKEVARTMLQNFYPKPSSKAAQKRQKVILPARLGSEQERVDDVRNRIAILFGVSSDEVAIHLKEGATRRLDRLPAEITLQPKDVRVVRISGDDILTKAAWLLLARSDGALDYGWTTAKMTIVSNSYKHTLEKKMRAATPPAAADYEAAMSSEPEGVDED